MTKNSPLLHIAAFAGLLLALIDHQSAHAQAKQIVKSVNATSATLDFEVADGDQTAHATTYAKLAVKEVIAKVRIRNRDELGHARFETLK